MPSLYDPVDVLTNAILGQESGFNPNAPTSVTGARGISQIQPQTWAKYSYPGENINNPTDNAAVGRRIIADYHSKYGFDPARIATAYFSGEKNVAPKNSQTPFLKDVADPTGKTTSSYVSDVTSRVNKLASNSQPVSASDILSSFEQNSPSRQQSGSISGNDILKQFETVKPAPQTGSTIPVPPTTPQEIADWNAKVAATKAQGTPSWWGENYHPLAAIPQTVGGGVQQLGQGFQDIRAGRVATGTGNVASGALNTILGPLIGPYNETTRAVGQAIGNPQAADVLSLVAPMRGFGAAAKSALPITRAGQGIIDLVGKENISAVLQKLESNPNLSLMDVSQPVKQVSAGMANNTDLPAAQNIMRSAYQARTAGRQDIVQDAVAKTLGPPIDVKQYTDALKAHVKQVGEDAIKPALEGAQPVGVQPLVDRLDAVIKAPGTADEAINRLTKLRNQITAEAGEDGFIDPNKLHGIQWRLRAEADNLSKSASGSERNLSKPLFDARNDMVDAIDNASGGKFRPALKSYRDANQIDDAFDHGFRLFQNTKIEDFPEYFQAWAKDATPAELASAKVGAITAIRKQVEGMQGGARRGENIALPTFNRQKLETLFGSDNADRLSGLLEDARNMTETNSLLYQNSKTGMVTKGQEYFQPRQIGAASGITQGVGAGLLGSMAIAGGQVEPGLIGLGLGALRGLHTATQYVGSLADKATATNFAKLASAGDSPDRNKLIALLRSAHSASQGNKISNLVPSMARLAAP